MDGDVKYWVRRGRGRIAKITTVNKKDGACIQTLRI